MKCDKCGQLRNTGDQYGTYIALCISCCYKMLAERIAQVNKLELEISQLKEGLDNEE